MPSTGNDNAWLRRYHPAEKNVRLVCFPHAGGSASAYLAMSRSLSCEMDVLALQYPGRQDRRTEKCLTGVPELAAGIRQALSGWLDVPFAFFGHSMGAVLAFEVTRLLRDAGEPEPMVLFASGRRAPSCHRAENVHRRDDDGVLEEIARLDGTDRRLLADEELLRMILPTIRGDYEAIETYAGSDDRIGVPITVLAGDSDPHTTIEEATAWQRHTSAGFDLHVFPGGHFFVEPNRVGVENVITDAVKARV